jgi:hypothetical protein
MGVADAARSRRRLGILADLPLLSVVLVPVIIGSVRRRRPIVDRLQGQGHPAASTMAVVLTGSSCSSPWSYGGPAVHLGLLRPAHLFDDSLDKLTDY